MLRTVMCAFAGAVLGGFAGLLCAHYVLKDDPSVDLGTGLGVLIFLGGGGATIGGIVGGIVGARRGLRRTAPLDPPGVEPTPAEDVPARLQRGQTATARYARPRRTSDTRRGETIAFIALGLAGLLAALGMGALKEGRDVGRAIPVLVPAMLLGAGALAYLGWRRRAATAYEVVLDPVPEGVMLGGYFEWGATIRARRRVRIEAAEIAFSCEERVLRSVGSSRKTVWHPTFQQVFPRPEQVGLEEGQATTLRTTFSVPPLAVPSTRAHAHGIVWRLRLTASFVAPPGCPDVQMERALRVLPQVSARQAYTLDDDPAIPISWAAEDRAREMPRAAGPMRAELQSLDAAVLDGRPVMCVGATRRLRLAVEADEEVACKGVWCWVGCRITAVGSDESGLVVLADEQLVHEGPLVEGHAINYPLTLTIPPTGPVSHVGEHVNCEWLVRVRVSIPGWRDTRIDLPMVVTPEVVSEVGEGPGARRSTRDGQ